MVLRDGSKLYRGLSQVTKFIPDSADPQTIPPDLITAKTSLFRHRIVGLQENFGKANAPYDAVDEVVS